MDQQFDLTFCFKGSRDYVHGTDTFNKLTELTSGAIEKIDLSFHDVIRKNLHFTTEKPGHDTLKVVFKYMENGEKFQIFGVERDAEVDCRYPYDEDKMVENSDMDLEAQTITLKTRSEYTFIEHIVALNKGLVSTMFKDSPGKWYFARLQLKKMVHMDDVKDLRIAYQSAFHLKLTKSAVIVNGEEVGSIYFSLFDQ